MKKTVSLILAAAIMLFMFVLPVCADSATISLNKSNVTVGSNVTVTLKYNAGFSMYGIDATLKYNSAVLQYVSGGTASGSTVKFVEGLSGEKTKAFSVVFKAIAEGSGSLSFSASASGDGDGSASAGATVNVTAVKPSSNANLGSLKLSEGTLSPEFKTNTTNYTASVKYNVESVTISANAAAGDSKVSGAGTFKLSVGENKQTITVTAASGDKKEYTVTVKRMTEEETAAALKEERDNNPYLIVVDGKDYMLAPDLTSVPAFDGYAVSSLERKGAAVGMLDDTSGKYQLFYATDTDGNNGAFYRQNSDGEFIRVNTLQSGSKLYVIEQFDSGLNVNPLFIPSVTEISGESLKCYKYASGKYNDFCVLYCYVNGENEYYRYDSAQNTIQREPGFVVESESVNVKSSVGLFDKISKLNNQAKMILILLVLASVLVVVLIVLMIIKAVSRNADEDQEEETAPLHGEPETQMFDLVGIAGEDNYKPGKKEDYKPGTEPLEPSAEPDEESEFLDPDEEV